MNVRTVTVVAIALGVVGVVEAILATRDAPKAAEFAALTPTSVSCTTPPNSGNPPPPGSIGTVGPNPVECFVNWPDGTRCVSVTTMGLGSTGSGASAALQCLFSIHN
jgi:hypothetical protein